MEVDDPISVKFRTLIEPLMAKTASEIVKVFAEVLMDLRVETMHSWRETYELKLEESEEVIFSKEANISVKGEVEDVLVSDGILQMTEDENTVEQSSVAVHKPTVSQTPPPPPANETQETAVRHKLGCPAESFGVVEHPKSTRKSEVSSNSPLQAISMVSPHQPSCRSSILASVSPNTEALTFNSDFLVTEDIQKVETAVDEKGIPGYHYMEKLADYLVELRNMTTMTLTNQQASKIIDLWQNLDSWDKQQIIYVVRQQDRLVIGHLQSPEKETSFTTKCDIGPHSSSTDMPDCCRLVEAIFIRLCHIHCNALQKDPGALTLVLQDYRKIRELVLGNGAVMQATSLQLVEVNLNSLIQWHNYNIKDHSLTELFHEGLPQSLPEIEDRARTIEPVQQQASAHDYRSAECTTGQANLKRRAAGEPPSIRPKMSTQGEFTGPASEPANYLQVMPHISVGSAPVLRAVHMIQPVCTFVCNPPQNTILQCATQDPTPPRQKRAYNRVVQGNTCKKCGQFRSAVTGHSQYKGIVYCPQNETLDKKQWLEEMRRKYK